MKKVNLLTRALVGSVAFLSSCSKDDDHTDHCDSCHITILGANGALTSQGHIDVKEFGGITNDAGSGVNGDLLLTTTGHTDGEHYTIILKLSKTY